MEDRVSKRRHCSQAESLCLAGLLILTPVATALANTTPALAPFTPQTITVGQALSIRVIPTDADGDVPSVRLLNFPDGAVFSDNGDGTRTFSWTPAERHLGLNTLTFEVIDALNPSLTAQRTLPVDVVAQQASGNNPPPQFTALTNQTITLGEQFNFRVNPVGPEGQVPALQITPLPASAVFSDNRDGTRQFIWQPNPSDPGLTEVLFTATDALNPLLVTTQIVTLTLLGQDGNPLPGQSIIGNPDNQPPFFGDLPDQTVALGNEFSFRVSAFDPDGDVPGLAINQLPAGASFNDNRDGTRTFRWSPLPINLGTTTVNFQAIDANDPTLRTNQSVELNLFRDPENPVNFSPSINGIHHPVIRAGDTLNQQVKAVDPDLSVPSLLVTNPPAGAQFPDNGDGTRTLIWPTTSADIGTTDISFLTVDNEDAELTATRTINVRVVPPEFVERPGERLRDLAEQRQFNIGFAAVLQSSSIADNELYLDTAAEEFNIVTPENSHKMGWIQPQPGEFRFEDADELADYAERNNMILHGHPLVWFAQLPNWVKQLDPVDAEQVMRDHIAAVAGRYTGRVGVWDVVNEALEENGTLRQPIWYQGMGSDYIRIAFEAAREADPRAALIYNEFDVAWENAKSDGMYTLLRNELEAGTPIDGVGFQMHLRSGYSDFESIERNLQRFADLDLEIYITEFDVALDAPDTFEQQASIYRNILEICLAQPSCNTIQSWGYTDRYSWRAPFKPLLLTDDYQVKPSYEAWQDTLQNFNQ